MSTAHGKHMDLNRAVQIVATDQKSGADFVSVGDAIEHVLNTMRLPEDPFVPGSWVVEDDGQEDNEVAQAYRLVLSSYDRTVPLMVAADKLAAHAGAEFLAAYTRRPEL